MHAIYLDNNATTRVHIDQFSPTGGVLYEVNDDVSVFAGYGEGFRPNSGSS